VSDVHFSGEGIAYNTKNKTKPKINRKTKIVYKNQDLPINPILFKYIEYIPMLHVSIGELLFSLPAA
jgi:hypothetical protein